MAAESGMTTARRTHARRILVRAFGEGALRGARLCLVAVACLCGLWACARQPFRGPRFSETNQNPSDAAAMVYIYNVASYPTSEYLGVYPWDIQNGTANNWLTAWLTERVYVDGNSKGVLTYCDFNFAFRIRRCEYMSAMLTPGSHEFRADYDPPFSPKVEAAATRTDLEAGHTYWIRTYSQRRALRGWPAPLYEPAHTVEVVDRDTAVREIADCTVSQRP
jgi:hypothetical protein